MESTEPTNKRRKRRWGVIAALFALVLLSASHVVTFLYNVAEDEYYSPDWESASTENARHRRVYVSSPAVTPAALQVADSVDIRVTDAWVERRTRIRYRWIFMRREIQDSTYRFVVHFVQVPHETSAAWTPQRARCFASFDLKANGQRVRRSGNAYVDIASLTSQAPFPDTIVLSVIRLPDPGPPPGAKPIEDRCPDFLNAAPPSNKALQQPAQTR